MQLDYDLAAPPPGMMSSPTSDSRSPSPDLRNRGVNADDVYCPLPTDFPFVEPIKEFSKLEHQCVPVDMLYTIVQTVALIQKSCR